MFIAEKLVKRPTLVCHSFQVQQQHSSIIVNGSVVNEEIRDYLKSYYSNHYHEVSNKDAMFDAVFNRSAKTLYSIHDVGADWNEASSSLLTSIKLEPVVPLPYTHRALFVGSSCAIMCSEAFSSDSAKQLKHSLAGKVVLEINVNQMNHYCADVAELTTGATGNHLLVMSASARAAFTDEQVQLLGDHFAKLVIVECSSLERYDCGVSQILHELL